jgi:hypothetical protein
VTVEERAFRTATRRLIPFLFLIYVVAYLDRVFWALPTAFLSGTGAAAGIALIAAAATWAASPARPSRA